MRVFGIEITLREVLVSVVIFLFMIGLGFFIAETIDDNVSTYNEKYFKALKVDNNPDLFDYAIRTQVGDMLSYGTFQANEPVSDSLTKGEFFAIKRIEEHYVMKTRVVTYKDSNGHTHTKTETYWEWDEVGRKMSNTKTFRYLNRDFDFKKVDFSHYKYLTTVNTSPNVRYQFYTIPVTFKGSLYSEAVDKTIKDSELFANQKIKDIMQQKEDESHKWVVAFWLVWIIFIIAITFGFMALENRYLNNK